MKGLLVSICLFFSIGAFAVINQPISNNFDALGVLKHSDKMWIKVKNGGTSDLLRGAPVVFDLTADDGATVNGDQSVITGLGGGKKAACITDTAIAAGKTGLCMVYGLHEAVLFGVYGTGGTPAGVNATAGGELYLCNADARVCASIAGIGDFSWQAIATAMDNASATGTIEAFVHAL